ncbi:uncharacterized protein DUF1707 [Actinocorallia herbida]|uniref:Uncharacterized protein DUF1707 n=1 Tax=Actinocorallia herbida TaxID=58109 RepID=A0A3N1D6R6_9ACTN|nr:DUF1707 domain-containing protein [Actinocorallia herbida]ROO89225.1 uncharacterized protein DUF1707 [Actinocorallia herbida]
MSGMSRDERRQAHQLAHEARRAAQLARRTALQGWAAASASASAPDTSRLRVGDTERGAVADALQEHFAQGRLDSVELDDRLGRALSAKTEGDLRGLMDDLPGPHPWEARVPHQHAPGYRPRERRRPHRAALALWLFLVVGLPLIFFGGGAVAVFAAVRVLFIIGLVVFIAKMVRRSRR